MTSFPGNPRAGAAHGHRRDLRLRRRPPASRCCCSTRARSPRCEPARSRRSRPRRSRQPRRGRSGSSAAACTGRGRRAAWPPPATDPGSATTPRTRPRERSPPSSAGRPGTRERALAADVVCCVTPGARDRGRRERPAPGTAPQHARRRRPRQVRGERRRGRRVRAVLRRVGAGVARRRADRRGAGRPRRAASRSPSSAPCSPAMPPGAPIPTR